MNSKNFGPTLNTRPVNMPQNAADSVMRLLHILMMPTGPQDEANTVAINVVSQKMSGGNTKAAMRAIVPIATIIRRLKRSLFFSSCCL